MTALCLGRTVIARVNETEKTAFVINCRKTEILMRHIPTSVSLLVRRNDEFISEGHSIAACRL